MAKAGRGNSSLFGKSQLKKAAASTKKSSAGSGKQVVTTGLSSGTKASTSRFVRQIRKDAAMKRVEAEKYKGPKVGETIMGKATARFAVNPLKVTGVSNQGKRGNVITAVGRDNRTYTFSESDVCRDDQGRFTSC